MLDIITEEKIRVRYGETDQMGHVYYANYLYWFEQGRGAWCRDRGFTYKNLEETGYMLPVVEAHLRYKQEIKYDDLVVIRVHLAAIQRASIKFQYEVFNLTTNHMTTEGYTWHVLMGKERHAITIPDSIKKLLFRNPAEHERLD